MVIKCQLFVTFAYLGVVGILAGIYYLVMTRKLGTPFNDSLTTEQKLIKQAAATQRRDIFYTGVGFVIATLAIFQPFKSCN